MNKNIVFMTLFCGALITLLYSVDVSAEVYKCPSPKGGLVFSDKPCPDALRMEGSSWVNVEEEQRKKLEEEQAKAKEKERELEYWREQDKIRAKQDAERKAAEEAALRARYIESEKRRIESENKRQAIIDEAKSKGLFAVEYVVEGSARSASLTYSNEQGGTEQHEVSLPWRKLVVMRKRGFAYISAQNKSDSGDIKVEVHLNGVPVKASQSSASYGIASASGRI